MWRWILVFSIVVTLRHVVPPAEASVVHRGPAEAPVVVRREAEPEQVPVLLYHHLDPGARGENGAVLGVAEFEAQMAWLSAHGYQAITTRQLADWLAGRSSLPEQPVLITFDDGYDSGFTYAYPILERYGLKAAIFMVTGLAGEPGYLSWGQMAELERSGVVEIQGHTHDGHFQANGVAALKAWRPQEVASDLERMRQSLVGNGVTSPVAFAYPYGSYDGEVLQVLPGQGVQVGFTVHPGYVRRGDPPLELKRWVVFPGTSECRFAEMVTGGTVCR